MSQFLLLLVVLLGSLSVVNGNSCFSNADCYNNGNCLSSVCECDANYRGDNCELEGANCSLAQIRTYKDNYQICVVLEGEMHWSYVCGNVNLCTVTNVLCPNCNFSCADTIVCSLYSYGCESGDSNSFCEIVNTADILSSLVTLILVITLIPILI